MPLQHSVVSACYRTVNRMLSPFDRFFINSTIPMAQRASHANWNNLLSELGNVDGLDVLEIGSREVTQKSEIRQRLHKANYVGFDYYAGPNVNVVGDAHKLSSYFPQGKKFDLIFTAACFEHFAMPWVVATEIAKMLRLGGTLLVETHFSFMAHERPWNFFQFSDMGLRALFSPALGFDCLEAGMSNPIVGRFAAQADKDLRFRSVPGLYCHVELLGRKMREVVEFDWNTVSVDELVSGTKYPETVEGHDSRGTGT